jgi:integrase/recombinase XerC
MIDSFLRYLTYEKRYSPHTVTSYRHDLEQLSVFLVTAYELSEPQSASYPMLRHWVLTLSESGLSARSINRKIIAARSFYKFLQKRGQLGQNAAKSLHVLNSGKSLPHFVREQEMMAIFDHREWGNGFGDLRDRVMLELLYGTGMRLSELTGLRIGDLDLPAGTVRVLGKRNKERVIPVSRSLELLLRQYLEVLKTEFSGNESSTLIVTNKGEPCYPMFVNRTVKRYLGAASVEKKSPHVLRHTYATHLLDHGADLNAVKDLLGHQSLAATQVYTHNTLGKLKKIFDQAHPKA